jgi:hypothetical protein
VHLLRKTVIIERHPLHARRDAVGQVKYIKLQKIV